MPMDGLTGFVVGFVTAVCLIVILYSLWNIVAGYIARIQAADKPQIVIHATSKTPNEVVKAASAARNRLILFFVLVWIVAVIGLEYFRPGTVRDVVTVFGWSG